jgi:hypothetical protein
MAWRSRDTDDESADDSDDDVHEFDGDTDDDVDDEQEGEDSGDEPTVPCPSCRAEMFEDSPRCPSCGRFVSAEDAPAQPKPLWVLVTAIVCLAIAVWMAFMAI